MRQMRMAVAVAAVLLLAGQLYQAQAAHRIGIGAHYWEKAGNIDVDNVEEQGMGWMVSYQYRPFSLIGIELDVEQLPERFAGAEKEVYAPQAYFILGSGLYAAVGVGQYLTDEEDTLFYALRAGIDLELLPRLRLDLNANYRFEDWDELDGEDISEDTIEIGAFVRFEI